MEVRQERLGRLAGQQFRGQVGMTVISDSASVVGGALPVVPPPPLGVCLCDLPIPTSSPSLETPASIITDPPEGPTAGCHWSRISQQRRCLGLGGHSLAGDPHSEPPASPRSLWGPWERGTGSLWGTGARKRRQMRGLQSPGRGTAHRRSRGSPGGWGAAGLQEKGRDPDPTPLFLVFRNASPQPTSP